MASTRRLAAGTVAVLSAALALAACGSDTTSESAAAARTTTTTATPNSGTSGPVGDVYGATYTKPPTDANPAAKGKSVWVVSVGQASPTGAASANSAMKAGKQIGWTMKLFDAKLDPAQFSNGIKQAISSKADGVVLVAVDCPAAKSALQQAKTAGVKTVGIYALDCDEVDVADPSLYSAQVGFGSRYANLAEAYKAWGADSAGWVIDATGGKADVLGFDNNEFLILKDYQQGFNDKIKSCTTCTLRSVPWLAADFGPKLTAITQASLLKNPAANAVQAGSNPTLGITQGLVQSGKTRSVNTIGGLGLAGDSDAIRAGQLTASNAWPTEWFGYASIDTLNSVFNGTEVRDSGLGWQITDKTHNLPATGDFVGTVDYASAYATSWGVTS